jgi:hypothetical protein
MLRFKHTTWYANHITTLDNTADVHHGHEGIVSAATAGSNFQLVHGSGGGGLIWN